MQQESFTLDNEQTHKAEQNEPKKSKEMDLNRIMANFREYDQNQYMLLDILEFHKNFNVTT